MIPLLKKDIRIFLLPLSASALGLLGSYALIFFFSDTRAPIEAMAVIGFFITGLLAPFYGGIAFAEERSDHSADFLAILPVTRVRICVSKLLAAGIPLLLMWKLNAVLLHAAIDLWMADQIHHYLSNPVSSELEIIIVAGVFTAFAFGVAWLLSTFFHSSAISTALSVLATGSLGVFYLVITRGRSPQASTWIIEMGLGGLACVAIGTIYYVQRVAP